MRRQVLSMLGPNIFGTLAIVAALIVGGGSAHAAPNFIHADGTRLVDAQGERFAVQGDQSRQLAGPRRLHVQIHAQARAVGDRRRDRGAWSGRRRRRGSGPNSATTTSPKPTSASSRRRASTPCACRCTGGCSSRRGKPPTAAPTGSTGRVGLCSTGWCRWCRDADLRVIIDLHAAPGGQTGVNHDDGFGLPAHILCAALSGAHRRAMEGARGALSRPAGDPRLRPFERADLAL